MSGVQKASGMVEGTTARNFGLQIAIAILCVGCSLVRINGKTWDEYQAEKKAESGSSESGGSERGSPERGSPERGSPESGGSESGGGEASGSTAGSKLAEATKKTDQFEADAKQKPAKLPDDVEAGYKIAKAFSKQRGELAEYFAAVGRRPANVDQQYGGKRRADGSYDDPKSTSSAYVTADKLLPLERRMQRAYEGVMTRWTLQRLEENQVMGAFEVVLTVFDPWVKSSQTGFFGKDLIATSAPSKALFQVNAAWQKVYKKESGGKYGIEGLCALSTKPWNGRSHNQAAGIMFVGDPQKFFVRCVPRKADLDICMKKDSPRAHILNVRVNSDTLGVEAIASAGWAS
ncbi:MAG TPA: hypothetical protein PK156_26710, partial [Polyangium sp.]|nr:hypothetical protein [Polyangium sp.]